MIDPASVSINFWSVLVAGIAAMVVGFIWYMPKVMGGMWMKAIGKTEDMIKTEWKPTMFFWTFLLALLTAYILAHFIQLVGADSLADAMAVAFWAWLGFVITVVAMNAMYEKRSAQLVIVNAGYQLVTMLIMSVILFSWQ